MKGPLGQLIGHLVEQGLFLRCASAQLEEADLSLLEQDITTHQSAHPVRVYQEGASQQGHLTGGIGTAQENELSLGVGLQVESPAFGKGPAGGRRFASGRRATTMGGHLLGRALLQGGQRRMLEAAPDFGLPQAVVVFDRGLEAGLSRGCKDRHDPQTQAQAHHPANRTGQVMGTLEEGVIVKLDLVGQAPGTPMGDQPPLYRAGGEGRRLWPGGHQTPVQRHQIEDFDQRTVFDFQPFDQIHLVQFDLTGSQSGQIPTHRRGRAPDPPMPIQLTTTSEDATHGADTGQAANPLLVQTAMHRHRTKLSQCTFLPQFLPGLQYQRLHRRTGASGPWSPTLRLIRPHHPIQAFPLGACHPSLHHTQTHPITTGYGTLRNPTTNQSHHRTALLLQPTF